MPRSSFIALSVGLASCGSGPCGDWYIDYDGDGIGTESNYTPDDCAVAGAGWSATTGDCDDADPEVGPGHAEVCDGIDEDCDGVVDDAPVDGSPFFADLDGDGYGDANAPITACGPGDGLANNGLDPDDADPTVPDVLLGDWSTLGNGPAHTGYFPGRATGALTEGWFAYLEQEVNPVAIEGDNVAVTTQPWFEDSIVRMLDANTGDEVWRATLEPANSLNPPTLVEGVVYVQRGNHNDDTQLLAFEADDGAEVWRAPHEAQWEAYYAPVVAGGGVFVDGGSYGGLYGFQADDGAQRFYVELPQYDEWTPAYADGVLYSNVEGELIAHDPATGAEQWSLDLGWDWHGWSMDTAPVVTSDAAYTANSTGLFAVDLASHTLTWHAERPCSGVPTVANGRVYVYTTDDDAVSVYDAATGDPLATYAGDPGLIGQPIVTDDLVLFANDQTTWVYDLATGDLVSALSAGGWLTLANGRLYAAGADGYLTTWTWTPG